MIKSNELRAAKERAETEGTAEAWSAYAGLLEERVEAPYSNFTEDPEGEAERTKHTLEGQRAAREMLARTPCLYAGVFQLVVAPDGRIYNLEARGQPSGAAHGRTGFHPIRFRAIKALEEQRDGVPSFLAFRDGKLWKGGWYHDLPAEHPVDLGYDDVPEKKRKGWDAGTEERPKDLQIGVEFPTEVPRPERLQPQLG